MQNKGLAYEELATRPALPAGDRSNGAIPAAPGGAAPVLDPKALAILRSLDPTGANGLLGRVLDTFQASVPRLAAKLAEARQAGNRKDIRFVVHTLRSSGGHVGALALVTLCTRIETAIVQGSSADLNPDLDALAPAIELTLTAIRQRQCSAQ